MKRTLIVGFLLAMVLAGCIQQTVEPVDETNETPVAVAPKDCFGPVCGVDGRTYETDCLAGEMGVAVAYTGECIKPEICEDSDGGINLAEAGTVTKGENALDDYCGEDGKIYEYSCRENEILLSAMDCPDGTACLEGACVSVAVENQTNATDNVTARCLGPNETDVYTYEVTVFQGIDYEDVCVTATVVKEYYCQNDSLKSINHECPGAYECRDGACMEMEKFCSETDDGANLGKRGNINVVRGINTILDEWDECVDDGSVNEWYCAENGSAILEEMWCGSGKKCKDGRCVNSNCSETDFGFNITVRGEAEGNGDTEKDYCIDDERLREYYCYGDRIISESVICPEGYICEVGACIVEDE